METIRRYGWKPELPHMRRESLHFEGEPMALPSFVDLRSKFPPCYDQLSLGSCTANALAGVVEFDRIKEKLPEWVPSRLFIYYNERAIEGTINSDAGAMISTGVLAISQQGAPPETDWPYLASMYAAKPSEKAYKDGLEVRTLQSASINQDLKDMRTCLANGFPFVFGFSVYDSFESDDVAKSGIVPLPFRGEPAVGGHAVVCVGYNDDTDLEGIPAQHFIVRNSWGPKWGQGGYCAMPYAYLTSSTLADDFYKVTSVA